MSTVRLTIHLDEKRQGESKEPLPLAPGDHEVFLVIRDLKDDEETRAWTMAPAKSLAAVWDNEDDSIYDEYLVRHDRTDTVPVFYT